MKILFAGASGTVTGSGYVLTADNGPKILVDLGMYQGTKEEEEMNYLPLSFNPRELAGVVLTHAHLDHCGRLPVIVQGGFRGKLFMTPATASLTALTLKDSARIANSDTAEYPPLYSVDDVSRILDRIMTVPYDHQFRIGPFEIVMKDAGHILGSASIVITDTTSTGPIRTIVFSGDLGNSPEDLVRPTEMIEAADAVVMETTYGDRSHKPEDTMQLIQNEFNAVEKSGGVLLIPAFSLDRTQEILHKIDHLKKEGRISKETPVFLDSPMAISATEIYEQYRELYNKELATHARMDDPFQFPGLTMTKDSRDSRRIQEVEGTKVIIAGNGMMAGGRIVRHAAKYLPLETTRLLIVGYQGVETLGRQIVEGAKVVTIDEQQVEVNATVTESVGMSAHADQPKLLKWLGNMRGVKKVFLVHGENPARIVFADVARRTLGIKDICIPELNKEILL